MKRVSRYCLPGLNPLSVSGILLLIFAVWLSGYGQSGKQRVDVLRVYRSEIEHWLLPTQGEAHQAELIAAFLVLPPFLEPDYSVCLVDSSHRSYLRVRQLDKNLWQELFTRAMQKQTMDLPLVYCDHSAPVSKRFRNKMLSAFEKIGPRKISYSSPVNYDGISYEFRWMEKGEMKTALRSYDLIAGSYESDLIRLMVAVSDDIKNSSFKESAYIRKFK